MAEAHSVVEESTARDHPERRDDTTSMGLAAAVCSGLLGQTLASEDFGSAVAICNTKNADDASRRGIPNADFGESHRTPRAV